jgi:hypothetical protein
MCAGEKSISRRAYTIQKIKYVKMLEEHSESAYNVCATEKFSIYLQALPKAEEVNL